MISTTGALKMNEALTRKKRRELKLLCNKKIYYFIEKYAKVDNSIILIQKNVTRFIFLKILVDCVRLTTEILCRLNIQIHELYNLLKFVRHKMDLPSLKLNKDNLIDVLFRIYHNSYLNNDCKLSCLF